MVIERKRMLEKREIKKKKIKGILASLYASLSMMCVNVCAKPSFNENGFKEETKSWADPITSYLLWVVPLCGVVSAILVGVFWLMHDEEYREQHPLKKRLVVVIIATIVIELIPTIYKLLNLS